MKKVLLLIISLFVAQATFAYETVLVDFPMSEGWHSVYYQTIYGEAILQYVPRDETAKNWTRAVVFHSYKNLSWTNSSAALMDQTTGQMEARNSSGLYKYTKYNEVDSIAVRIVKGNKLIPTQGEIYRVSNSHEGLITMHYINKNVQNYKDTYDQWYDIVKNIRIYWNYYREDRILDKSMYFEI